MSKNKHGHQITSQRLFFFSIYISSGKSFSTNQKEKLKKKKNPNITWNWISSKASSICAANAKYQLQCPKTGSLRRWHKVECPLSWNAKLLWRCAFESNIPATCQHKIIQVFYQTLKQDSFWGRNEKENLLVYCGGHHNTTHWWILQRCLQLP